MLCAGVDAQTTPAIETIDGSLWIHSKDDVNVVVKKPGTDQTETISIRETFNTQATIQGHVDTLKTATEQVRLVMGRFPHAHHPCLYTPRACHTHLLTHPHLLTHTVPAIHTLPSHLTSSLYTDPHDRRLTASPTPSG